MIVSSAVIIHVLHVLVHGSTCASYIDKVCADVVLIHTLHAALLHSNCMRIAHVYLYYMCSWYTVHKHCIHWRVFFNACAMTAIVEACYLPDFLGFILDYYYYILLLRWFLHFWRTKWVRLVLFIIRSIRKNTKIVYVWGEKVEGKGPFAPLKWREKKIDPKVLCTPPIYGLLPQSFGGLRPRSPSRKIYS